MARHKRLIGTRSRPDRGFQEGGPMQRKTARLVLILALGAALISAGCVELLGQRITLRYDPQKDELHLLLFYDGMADVSVSEAPAMCLWALV